jgi:hypothetical protein
MVNPKNLFGSPPQGAFVEQIGDLKVGDILEIGDEKVPVQLLQITSDTKLIAYYEYKSGASGCSYLTPTGRRLSL